MRIVSKSLLSSLFFFLSLFLSLFSLSLSCAFFLLQTTPGIEAALKANKPILLVSPEEEHKKDAFYEHGFFPHNNSLFTFVQPWTSRTGRRSYKIVELGEPLYGGGMAPPVSANEFDPDDSDKSHG